MRRILLCLALLAVPLSGCAFLKNLFSSAFRKPTFRFQHARLADASLSGITLDLTYVLDNPNPIGLSLAEVDYALFVEGKQVVAGRPPKGLQIPARRSAELVFPAQIKFADFGSVVQTFLTKDYARYRAEGHVGFDTPIGILKFPLSYENQFEVPKVPAVSLSPPRITQLSFQGATVEFPLTVTNRNSYDLPIAGLGGSLAIAGAPVGSVSTGNLGALQGRGTRQVTVPLTIRFASALAAANALRQGNGTVSFEGQLQSGALSVPIRLSQHLNFVR